MGDSIFIIFIIAMIFIIGLIPIIIAYDKEKQEKKKIEQKQKAAQAREEHRKTMQKIIDFASKNGFKEIERMLNERDSKFNSAMSHAVSAATTLIFQPTYSRGVKEGSLADNVAYLANIEKQKEYDKQVSDKMQRRNLADKYSNEAYQIEKQIIKYLKNIPNSTEYVMLLQNYFNDSRNELKRFSKMK